MKIIGSAISVFIWATMRSLLPLKFSSWFSASYCWSLFHYDGWWTTFSLDKTKNHMFFIFLFVIKGDVDWWEGPYNKATFFVNSALHGDAILGLSYRGDDVFYNLDKRWERTKKKMMEHSLCSRCSSLHPNTPLWTNEKGHIPLSNLMWTDEKGHIIVHIIAKGQKIELVEKLINSDPSMNLHMHYK